MMNWIRRRRARRLPFDQAAALFVQVLDHGVDVERSVMIALAERAHDTAPTQRQADTFRAYRNALRSGHQIKIGTFNAEFRFVPVPHDLQEAVEEALATGADE